MKTNILVVDDNEDLKDLVAEFLTDIDDNYQVSTADGYFTAVELLEKEEFHLVLTDKNMPGVDGNTEGGMDLIRYIKEKTPTTEVIMMTGYATLDSAIEAMKLGAFDYVLKPFALDVLHDKVSRVLTYQAVFQESDAINTYKLLHNEILGLMEKEVVNQDQDVHDLLKKIDTKLDQYFHNQKKWEFSWFNISDEKENK